MLRIRLERTYRDDTVEVHSSSGEHFNAATYQPADPVYTNEFVEADRRYAGRPVPLNGQKPHYGKHTRPAVESDIGADIGRLIGGILPNTYYSRPKYRYPYYDKSGKARSNVILFNYLNDISNYGAHKWF